MAEFQVEICLRLEADSQHDAALWASKALDASAFANNPDIRCLRCYVQEVKALGGNGG